MTEVSNSDGFHARWEAEHRVLSGEAAPQELVELADEGVGVRGGRDVGELRDGDAAAGAAERGRERTSAKTV